MKIARRGGHAGHLGNNNDALLSRHKSLQKIEADILSQAHDHLLETAMDHDQSMGSCKQAGERRSEQLLNNAYGPRSA